MTAWIYIDKSYIKITEIESIGIKYPSENWPKFQVRVVGKSGTEYIVDEQFDTELNALNHIELLINRWNI